MNCSPDPILSNVFRPSVRAWRANYVKAKSADTAEATAPKPASTPARPSFSVAGSRPSNPMSQTSSAFGALTELAK